jgi:hypothetical protein
MMTNRKLDILYDSRGELLSFLILFSGNVPVEHRSYLATFPTTYERKLTTISMLPNDPIINLDVTKDYLNVNEAISLKPTHGLLETVDACDGYFS